MITVVIYQANHQLRIKWNKFAKDKQYAFAQCNLYCVYFMGILIYKRVTPVNSF